MIGKGAVCKCGHPAVVYEDGRTCHIYISKGDYWPEGTIQCTAACKVSGCKCKKARIVI